MKELIESSRVGLRYVPSNYHCVSVGRMVFWARSRWESIEQLFSDSVEHIEELLEYSLRRTLHVVIYENNEEARAALNRNMGVLNIEDSIGHISPGSPWRSTMSGLFKKACPEFVEGSVQSCPEASRREGRSPFCARSVLVLREHGKRARTPLAAFFNRPIIDTALSRCSFATMSDELFAKVFEDLNSPERQVAFAVATARVWNAVQRRGIRFVFENLSHPEHWAEECRTKN